MELGSGHSSQITAITSYEALGRSLPTHEAAGRAHSCRINSSMLSPEETPGGLPTINADGGLCGPSALSRGLGTLWNTAVQLGAWGHPSSRRLHRHGWHTVPRLCPHTTPSRGRPPLLPPTNCSSSQQQTGTCDQHTVPHSSRALSPTFPWTVTTTTRRWPLAEGFQVHTSQSLARAGQCQARAQKVLLAKVKERTAGTKLPRDQAQAAFLPPPGAGHR